MLRTNQEIPLQKTHFTGAELDMLRELLTSGNLESDGTFSTSCTKILEDRLDTDRAFLTPSCTSALELAATAMGLERGDEVIMPSYTFVSTASAFARLGGKPVFVDVEPLTYNINADLIESAITKRTRAICVVHYAGVGCDMDQIMALADKYGLIVVEDAAHALGGNYNGQALGSIGHFGTLSFHHTKNYTCGEGGALLVNRKDAIAKVEIIRDKGTNRQKFFRGEVDKYTWVDMGFSPIPSEINAAFLLAQLRNMDEIQTKREMIYNLYKTELSALEDRGLIKLPSIPDGCESAYHLFHLSLQPPLKRNLVIRFLSERGITASFHYVPLHESPVGSKFHTSKRPLPVTQLAATRLLRLPFYTDLNEASQNRVIDQFRAATTHHMELTRPKASNRGVDFELRKPTPEILT